MRPFIILAIVFSLLAVFAAGASYFQTEQIRLATQAMRLDIDAALADTRAVATHQKEVEPLVMLASRQSSEAVTAAKREDPRVENFRGRIRVLEEASITAHYATPKAGDLEARLQVIGHAVDECRRRLTKLEPAE